LTIRDVSKWLTLASWSHMGRLATAHWLIEAALPAAGVASADQPLKRPRSMLSANHSYSSATRKSCRRIVSLVI
jgi:hypothetical protein